MQQLTVEEIKEAGRRHYYDLKKLVSGGVKDISA